jgi:hypothetical protein
LKPDHENFIIDPERIKKMGKPTLESKVCAATFIAVHGADFAGIRTKLTVMWPCRRFTDREVEKEASSLLGCVHNALLKVLPPQDSDQILKDSDERLSFVLGSRPQNDNIRCQDI